MKKSIAGITSGLLGGEAGEAIVAALLDLAKSDPEEAGQMLRDLYDSTVQEYRPLIGLLPAVAEGVGGDIASVLAGVLRLVTSIQEEAGLSAEIRRFRVNQAKGRFVKIEIMIEAGFTREEAMSLLLADIDAMKTAAQAVSKSSVGSKD